MTNEEKINLIGQKILILSNNLDKYQTELNQLKQQLELLQQGKIIQQPIVVPPVVTVPEIKTEIPELKTEDIPVVKIQEPIKPIQQQQYQIPPQALKPKAPSDFNFEAFVGGKLITIIGIIILVIGLGIGVKYAIDNDMLGPLARIVLAYAAGGILLAIALKLKAQYKTFSAVLLSGGMASLYFTTFAAYSMYGMFGQIPAFMIMVIFTAFTVFAATVYNLQVIGVIGLVGAYAVPMLLSDGSGKIEIMFTYMLIINCGVLILSFKKYWQVLNHTAYAFTWIIFASWFAFKYPQNEPTIMTLTFAFLFFLIFYISNMTYKIIKHEKFGVLDIIRIVSNSFIFFGIGYATLDNKVYTDYLGLFTIANALIHFVFSYIVFKNKMLDRKLFYLLIAMVLSFITIAVPVQLEGNWVTLFWAAEAVLLFSIGRYKAVRFYEWLGYIMILLAVFSLVQDWSKIYYSYEYSNSIYQYVIPFANIYMFTSLFVIASLGTMIYIHHKKNITEEEHKQFGIYKFTEYALPVILFIITYCTFSNELTALFNKAYQNSLVKVPSKTDPGSVDEVYNYNVLKIKDVILGIYNLVFFIAFTLLSIYKAKATPVRWIAFGFNILMAILFVTVGLSELGDLRYNYIYNDNIYYTLSSSVLSLRYICLAVFAVLLYLNHRLLKTETFHRFNISNLYAGCFVHFFILVILSNELINIHELKDYGVENYSGTNAVYKIGFTVLWGIYSFILIAWGIYKKNVIVRISAISLFGITLIKLIIFDTWNLSTGYKVIAYMLLGVILLIVAFLYQKFKVFIFGEEKKEQE